MTTVSLPSGAFGAPSKRARKSGGFIASVRDYFQPRHEAEVAAYAFRVPTGRWSDSDERDLNDALLHGEWWRSPAFRAH